MKGAKKSSFSLFFSSVLYGLSFALLGTAIMFPATIDNTMDFHTSVSNYQNIILKDGKEGNYNSETETMMNIDMDKWVLELGPIMEIMYEQPFNDWESIKSKVFEEENLDLQVPSDDNYNSLYYSEFLKIWQYQNENVEFLMNELNLSNEEELPLPLIDFGYNGWATLAMRYVDEDESTDKGVKAVRLNPIDIGLAGDISNMEGDNIVNQPYLIEGRLPDYNDPSLGTSEDNPAEIAIFKEFGDSNDLEIGDTIHIKGSNDVYPYEALNYANFYGEIVGYVDIVQEGYFNITTSILPDYSNQTAMLMPYDAFNNFAQLVANDTHAHFEINIAFREEMELMNEGVSINDIDNSSEDSNSFIFKTTALSYFSLYEDKEEEEDIYPFYDILLPSSDPNNSLLLNSDSMVSYWDTDEYSTHQFIVFEIYDYSERTKKTSIIFASIFIIITLIFILMILKRKVRNQSKEIGILRALGYSTRDTSSSFTTIAFLIIFFGGILVMILVMPLTNLIISNIFVYWSFSLISIPLNFEIFLFCILIPLLLMILVVWFFVIFLIKKPPIGLLNNSFALRPNIFVRKSGFLTSKLSFTNSYALKNSFRALGRSSVIFATSFFSCILLLFGIIIGTTFDRTSETMLSMLNYDYQHIESNGALALTQEQIDQYGTSNFDNMDDEYTFGVDRDYQNFTQAEFDSDHFPGAFNTLFPDGYDENNIEDVFIAWQQDITKYMREVVIVRDETYFNFENPELIMSFQNSLYLYLYLSNDLEHSELRIQNLEYLDEDFNVWIYTDMNMNSVIYQMTSIFFQSLSMEPGSKKVLIDIQEIDNANVSPYFSTSGEKFELISINGNSVNPPNDAFVPEYNLGLSNDIGYGIGYFNFENEHGTYLTDGLIEQEDNEPAPILVDYPSAEIFGIEKGDMVTLEYLFDDYANPPPKLTFEVVGVYYSNFEIGWITNLDHIEIQNFIDEIITYAYDDDYNWILDGPNGLNETKFSNFLFSDYESISTNKYACMSSGKIENDSMTLLNNTIDDGDGYDNVSDSVILQSCFDRRIDTESYVEASIESNEAISVFTNMFIIFSFVIVVLMTLVLGNEIIQSSRREVSTLKAIGYSSAKNTWIVISGQMGIMIITILIAIPLSILALNFVSYMLMIYAGIYLNFAPIATDILIIVGVLVLAAFLIYCFGLFIYRYVKNSESLQRE